MDPLHADAGRRYTHLGVEIWNVDVGNAVCGMAEVVETIVKLVAITNTGEG